jgi:hypothetical protein
MITLATLPSSTASPGPPGLFYKADGFDRTRYQSFVGQSRRTLSTATVAPAGKATHDNR